MNTKYPLYTALTQLYDMHGVELSSDLFETFALSAYNKIGNKDYRMYRIKARPQKDIDGFWFIEKPCNLHSIEAITGNLESVQETTTLDPFYSTYSQPVEQWIEAGKSNHNELYIPGKFIKYKELDDKILFTQPYEEVNLLYKGQYVDEEGLPYINDKEMEAIVAYCVYAHDQKQARMTKDQNTLAMANLEYQLWQKACSEARTPMSISQNTMNEVLDARTSWGRHTYGASSTKPVL